MSFMEVMQAYFRGEQIEAIAFIIPIGVLLTAFGVIALKVERGGFAWGTAVPCILFGLLLIGVGAGIAAIMLHRGQFAVLIIGVSLLSFVCIRNVMVIGHMIPHQ